MNYKDQAQILVDEYIKPQGITDQKVLAVFAKTPRHEFVPKEYRQDAYLDIALPIGKGQTISQPSLAALMTQTLNLKGDEKVLEVGTGSGYQAAILSRLAKEVYTIEILPKLAAGAKKVFTRLGYKNIHAYVKNGSLGLEKFAPFDAIIVTAGAKKIPRPLIDQLNEGGRIVIPVGERLYGQRLVVGTKKHRSLELTTIESVAFVPLIGKHGWKK